MINVFIVDDHQLIRTAIKMMIDYVKDMKVIGEAETGEMAVQMLRANAITPDVILMDLKMPGIGGLEATHRLLNFNSKLKIIALTSCDGEGQIPMHIMRMGAAGYITKTESFDELIVAIRKVNDGQSYITAEVAQRIALHQMNNNNDDQSPFSKLSHREMQIVLMVINGQGVQQIADKLFLSPKTVNTYRYRTFEKLHIKNNVELMHMAYHYKILEPDALLAA